MIYPPRPEPIRVEIELTNVCNASCIFCPRWNMSRPRGYLDLDEFSSFLDRLDTYRRTTWLNEHSNTVKFPRLVFAGLGEPLLHPRIVEIVSEGSARGFETELVTNGSLLSPSLARGLATAGLDSLAISLHSLKPQAYYRLMGLKLDKILPRVAETLKALDNTNVGVEIWRVGLPDGAVAERTMQDEERYSGFLAQYKKNIRIFGPTPAWNRGGQLSNNYWPKVHDSGEIWCHLLYFTFNVTWDGTTVVCCCDYSQLTIPLGNAWKESITTLQSRRGKMFKSPFKERICRKCRRPKDKTYQDIVFPMLKL